MKALHSDHAKCTFTQKTIYIFCVTIYQYLDNRPNNIKSVIVLPTVRNTTDGTFVLGLHIFAIINVPPRQKIKSNNVG